MKIVGHENPDLPIDKIRFIELAEVAFEASPFELRKIAAFLSQAADNMETMGVAFDHEHLSEYQPGFEDSPHVVVFRSSEKVGRS
jgi:hypothetical protein